MLPFIPAVSICLVGILFAAQFLRPRLPAYSFRIRGIVPKWIDRTFKARLGAGVWLRNDNYVPIEIHALSCDIYYPDWDGALNHIGHVHDVQQVFRQKEEITSEYLSISQALWKIEARQTFETNDQMFLQPVSVGLGVLSSLSYDLMRKYGTVNVPSSMVVRVKANKKIPLTMSILCDNELNTLTLEMVGLTCELDNLMLGWYDLPEQVEKLRVKTIAGHQPQVENGTRNPSIVGRKPEPPNFHDEFEKAAKRISWRDVPILAF
jgi:hypothetical protein